jgi:putative phosphoesterase
MASSVQSGCSARKAAAFSCRRSAGRNFCAGDIACTTCCASVFIGFTNQYKAVSLFTERGYFSSLVTMKGNSQAMANAVKRIGLISDTHGLLRKEAVEALRGSELILHAGDVGKPEILEELRKIAPVVVVRGNVDTADWAQALPETAVAKAGSLLIYMLHDVKALDLNPATAGFHIVVSGHSHKAGKTERDGVLYINPGSAGPRRFQLPVTVGLLRLGRTPYEVEFMDLEEPR